MMSKETVIAVDAAIASTLPMFSEMADAIFERAGVKKEGNEVFHQQAVDILSAAMARTSVTMGLSMERVEFFQKQKDALVQDLLDLKAAGEIAE
jgi:hypothetical protein